MSTVETHMLDNCNMMSDDTRPSIAMIDQQTFIHSFARMGRADQFSREALIALFEYFEDVAPDYELDVIEICCGYSEHDTALEAALTYGYAPDTSSPDEHDDEESEALALEWLSDRTCVIAVQGGSVVIANY